MLMSAVFTADLFNAQMYVFPIPGPPLFLIHSPLNEFTALGVMLFFNNRL